jgi:sporulation protein YlmC with PRC-barrel domain
LARRWKTYQAARWTKAIGHRIEHLRARVEGVAAFLTSIHLHRAKEQAVTQTDHSASLRSISDDKLETGDPAEDVRGRNVLDNTGKDIGNVDDLLIDDREHKVRFLRVATGGFWGLGETKFLIPVDAIAKVDDETVQVDQTREHVASGPQYDPALMNVPYLTDVYGHYGYSPWWGPGYMYPMYPYFP